MDVKEDSTKRLIDCLLGQTVPRSGVVTKEEIIIEEDDDDPKLMPHM